MKLSAAILGAGQCFRKMLPGLRSHFAIRAIYDPDSNAIGLSCLDPEERSKLVSSEDELFRQLSHLDVLFILSPPREHVRQVVQACHLGKPVFVEKPLAIQCEELPILEGALKRNAHVYFSDLYRDVRGAALLRAFRPTAPDVCWIDPFLSPQDGLAFLPEVPERLGEIEFIRGALLERSAGDHGLPPRKWLTDPVQGGVLLDLAYHYLTLFFTLFEESLSVEESILGYHGPGRSGPAYDAWARELHAAETYALLKLRSSSGIQFEMEVSNHWNCESREFYIRGSKGNLLMNFGGSNGKKNILITNLSGKISSFELAPRYWDLVSLGFYNYVRRGETKPHGFREGKAAVRTIVEAQEVAAESGGSNIPREAVRQSAP